MLRTGTSRADSVFLASGTCRHPVRDIIILRTAVEIMSPTFAVLSTLHWENSSVVVLRCLNYLSLVIVATEYSNEGVYPSVMQYFSLAVLQYFCPPVRCGVVDFPVVSIIETAVIFRFNAT